MTGQLIRRFAVATASIGIAVPAVTVALVAARVLLAERRSIRWVPSTTAPPTIAIVVFGAEALPEGPSGELRARLDHGLRLWSAGAAPVIIVSGGIVDSLDEVDTMTEYLMENGVAASAILPGRPGENTRATLRTLRVMSDELHLGPFIGVSSSYHAHRVEAEGRRCGVVVTASAPDDSPEVRNPSVHRARLVTEVVATIAYALPPGVAARVKTGAGSWRHTLPMKAAGQLPLRAPRQPD